MIELINWILEEGRDGDDLGAILAGLSERLVARGVPLCRTTLLVPTLDPTTAVISYLWWRDKGLSSAAISREDAYGAAFQRSPVHYLLEHNIGGERWPLEDPAVAERFVLFQELRALGVTEYVLQFVPFSRGRIALRGAALSMATDRGGGFVAADMETVSHILPALSLVAYRIGLSRFAAEALGAYLGPQTGERVLQGMIQRGQSQTISAALLLADLRGFTALADRAPAAAVVGWLNDHLECIGDAVVEHGGEVLKFLGDGLLAVFPAASSGADRACRAAVEAALDAGARNDALNRRRFDVGAPALDLSIALHFGDVAYGNIGTARRLDFTVIGPAVNEVSRMEALGKQLGHALLLSESIAHRCDRAVANLGPHALRGVADTREVFVLVGERQGCGGA